MVDNAPETLEHTNERLKALEGLGDALFAMSLLQEAAREFERLFNSAESGVVKGRALRKAMLCSYWRGDPAHSLEIATKANQFAQLDCLEYARLRLYKGFIDSRSLVNDKEAMEEVEGVLQVLRKNIPFQTWQARWLKWSSHTEGKADWRRNLPRRCVQSPCMEELEDFTRATTGPEPFEFSIRRRRTLSGGAGTL